jgi:hypothetical protein
MAEDRKVFQGTHEKVTWYSITPGRRAWENDSVPKDLALQLRQTIDRELPNLQTITEADSVLVPGQTGPIEPGRWSRREELGHLIDSATNNHIRFVLATINTEFRGPGYAQDNWVTAHGYQQLPWSMLVDFWYRYNVLLVHVIERIPEDHMNNRCVIGWGVVSLRFVIEDYVLHMQHHLDHIMNRDKITQYPGAA